MEFPVEYRETDGAVRTARVTIGLDRRHDMQRPQRQRFAISLYTAHRHNSATLSRYVEAHGCLLVVPPGSICAGKPRQVLLACPLEIVIRLHLVS